MARTKQAAITETKPAKRKRIAPAAEPADTETPEDEDEPQEHALIYDAEDAKRRMDEYAQAAGIDVGDYSADATAHVSMFEDGKEVNVWRGDPLQYDLPAIAREFGSGEYRLKIYMRDPVTGMRPKRIDERIWYRLTVAEEKQRRKMLESLNADAAPQPSQDITALMQTMMQGFQASMMQMAQALKPQEKDPMQTVEGLTRLMGAMRGNEPPARTFVDSINELKTVAEAVKVISPPPAAPVLNDDGGINSGAVIMKGIDMFTEAMRMNKQQGAAPQPPANPAHQLPGESDAEQLEDLEQMKFLISMQIKTGTSIAKVNGDCSDYAETVYEMMPDEMIIGMMQESDFLGKLAEYDSRVKLYPDWWHGLRRKIAEMAVADGLLTREQVASILPESTTEPATGAPNAGIVNTGGNT